MHSIARRTGHGLARLAFLFILTLVLPVLGTEAAASGQAQEEAAVRSAMESYLRAYQRQAMLYEEQELLFGTVADPSLSLPQGAGEAVFRFGEKEATLDQLRENMLYLEKKAMFYAGMRQMQGIYREDLRLVYAVEDLTLEGNACRASVRETAEFRYTGSSRLSVYETGYTVRLVRLGTRWLVADVADGSLFDKTYKTAGFDPQAALAEFAGQLERENCTLSFSGQATGGGDQIPYNGQDAAAYAYTYSRRSGDAAREAFYNPRFYSYAGEGGDCQNFASQCIWAGFGGSEDGSSIQGRNLPMDTAGSSQWFGRAAAGGRYSNSWLSCQSFRQYLTGNRDGSGGSGSNSGTDAGIYAAVLNVGAGSALSAVTPEELVGAIAHVEGGGGTYSHAIVLTAAAGTSRSQIWFCSHTRDVTHVKLGDCYIGPIKVFIPRYFRTGGPAEALRAERLEPVEAGESRILTARAGTLRGEMSITVTAPDGTAEQAAYGENTDSCRGEYRFIQPGMYRIDCRSIALGNGPADAVTYYVRCWEPEETGPDVWDAPASGADDPEMPGWLRQPGDEPAEPEPPETETEEPPEQAPEETPPDSGEIPGWLLS